MVNLNVEIENNKKLAALQRETAINTKAISIDTMTHAQRWLTASVLAINSGGLIATVDRLSADDLWTFGSFAMFYIGLLLALVMGWSAVSVTQKSLPHHSKLIAFWETASIEGEINGEELQLISTEMINANARNFGYARLSWWSFGFFTIGIAWSAFSGLFANQIPV